MNDEKLQELEALLAHHERVIEDLSDIVAKQWDEISTLKTRLSRTQEKLKTVEDLANSAGKSDDAMSITEMAAAEKPPHY